MKMIDQMAKSKYSYFVNAMLFLFVFFVNTHNTLADIALFSLSMAGVYILKKNNINPFKDRRLRVVLLITAGYYFINLVVFFINGTNFAKYLQTDLYFLLAVFVAAALLHAKVNINLFFSGIRLALLFLGSCHLLSRVISVLSPTEVCSKFVNDFDSIIFCFLQPVYTNIYISVFAPVTVLMMFLSIINFDNDKLINKLLGLTAFIFGMILVVDSSVRLSWLVFIILAIVLSVMMFKKKMIRKFSLMMSIILLGVFIYFITTNNTINDQSNKVFNEISSWANSKNLDTSIGLRLEMYKSGYEAFTEKPFFGHGFLNGTKEASKYADLRVSDRIYNFVQLHSEYINTMVEKGLFGLLSLSILLLSPALIIVRNYSKDDIYIRIGVISSISFILFGTFNTSFGDTTFKAFYVLLICLFLPNIFKERLH